jgi:dihydroorotate dehydrogenase (fumarate)
LYNRFYEPDFDIDTLKLKPAPILGLPGELHHTLRHIGMMSMAGDKINISVSGGVFNAEAMIKSLLAGAQTAQLCSVLYQKGFGEIKSILSGLKEWMLKMNFETIESFRGKLNYHEIPNPEVYERSQFMKYFSDIE